MKYFVANRSDGSGSRIFSLVNAMYLANRFKNIGDFRFIWPNMTGLYKELGENFRGDNQGINVIGMSIEAKENIFDKDFIDKYFITNNECKEANIYEEINEDKIGSNPYSNNIIRERKCSNFLELEEKIKQSDKIFFPVGLGELDYLCQNESELKEYKNSCRYYFQQIDFVPQIKQYIQKAQNDALNLGSFSAIHFRSGDIVHFYSPIRLQGNKSVYHATHASLVLELIKKCLKDGDSKIILFGDDIGACKEIIKIINNENVIFADTLRPIENISNAQSFYYDLTLMSMATKLYGTNSALVRFSRLLNADLIFFNSYSSAVFSQKEQYDQISRNLSILSNLNEAQLSFLAYHHYLAGNNTPEYRLANRGGDLINHLKMALFYDPHNHKYTLNMIKVLLDNKNYTQAEDICKILLYKNSEEIIKLLLTKDWFGQWFGNVFNSFTKNIDLNFPYTCYITARIMEYKNEPQSANAIYTLINDKIVYPNLKKYIQNKLSKG
ncbi:hypothetical protein [Campylobacter porcelli]|uniref:hypothetical protein n=1 Tax=Campylobacter porcelli TaxID=1660073 RepID=UPI000A33FD13|nr:hypothetical protein [Campylobacter sp. P0078]